MDVVIRKDLCPHETHFIKERQSKVQDALCRHAIHCPENIVPRVALLGSGGGQRAHTGFLGVMRQLGKEDLLDCMLYVARVSGSTWCMSSLYKDPQWTQNAEEAANEALLSMSEGEGVTFHDGVYWMKQRHEEGYFSLSDVWGVLTCRIKGVSLETRFLMDDKVENGAIPYPLYSAIEKHCFHKEQPPGCCSCLDRLINFKTPRTDFVFEFSPHEVGFLEPEAYVKTSLLKQDFVGGKVKSDQRRKPMDMVQLQGICGCAMGDFDIIIKYMKDTLWDWIHSIILDLESGAYSGKTDIVFILADLMKKYADTEHSLSELERLKCLLGVSYGEFSLSLKGLEQETWRNMIDQERKELVEAISDELIASIDKWGHDHSQFEGTAGDVWWVMRHVMPLFIGWRFGTVANFLYKFRDDAIPKDMIQKKQMHLIDAGLYLNSPYPSALRAARCIDLIISFDFSDGDPFETLKVASQYAVINHLPFPKVDPHLDSKCPKSCYVFEEGGKPTVIHIPLFNMDNCENEETLEMEKKEYTTVQWPYRDKTKIDHLADLAAKNVRMNREIILSEIEKIVQ
ncbi:cytosolic phospholipase A2 delta-like [Alosa sapidissima]|uniref:cytosolic phospholipase A2 delta-like n=1 Tax=Alosa sapidissima TaxID=34773 RepID=UPI001C0A5E4A|nr:cytosolic phospholipase A2 delta-like [Alosa sapidissima]